MVYTFRTFVQAGDISKYYVRSANIMVSRCVLLVLLFMAKVYGSAKVGHRVRVLS